LAAAVTAILDANVLYPAPLRDLLMRMAMQDIYLARWTDQIHDEWTRNVLQNRPDIKPEQLARTRELMNAHVRDCVVDGYQHRIPNLALPDPDDRHVLAAAIECNAQLIVTFNVKDFPTAALLPFGIEAQHPDDFIVSQRAADAEAVDRAIASQLASLRHPPQTMAMLFDTLERQQLTQAMRILRARANEA
jgi:predicted nucleic acid-binding protein